MVSAERLAGAQDLDVRQVQALWGFILNLLIGSYRLVRVLSWAGLVFPSCLGSLTPLGRLIKNMSWHELA